LQASTEAALSLFSENDPLELQWAMKEDMVAFLATKIEFNDLKGEKFELNRVCDRAVAAIDKVMKSNTDIFAACEAVINGAKIQQPRLNPIIVRATQK